MKINCKNNLERNGTKKNYEFIKNFKYDNDYDNDYDNIGINWVKNFIKALKIIYQNFWYKYSKTFFNLNFEK